MIQSEHIQAAFQRFEEFLRVGSQPGVTQRQANERGARMWESVGLTEEVRVEFTEYAAHYLGSHVAAFAPDVLLYGALFALMAADVAGELPTPELTDEDLNRLLEG